MRQVLLTVILCSAATFLRADAAAPGNPRQQELAQQARYAQQLAIVLGAVADDFAAQAQWLSSQDAASQAEHDRLVEMAALQRDLAAQAQELAASLQSSLRTAPAPRSPPPPELAQRRAHTAREMHTLARLLESTAEPPAP